MTYAVKEKAMHEKDLAALPRPAGPEVRCVTLCDTFPWDGEEHLRGDTFRARVCVDLIQAKAHGKIYFNYPNCVSAEAYSNIDSAILMYTGPKNAEHLPAGPGGLRLGAMAARCVGVSVTKETASRVAAADPDFQVLDTNSFYVGGNATIGNFDKEIAPHLPTAPEILFIRDNGAGDVIMSIPTVRELKRRYPASKITYATLPPNLCLLNSIDCIDRAISVSEMRIDSSRWDLIVNWAGALENYSLPRNRGPRIDSFSKHIGLGVLSDRHTELQSQPHNRFNAEYLIESAGGTGTRGLIGMVMQAATWNRTWPVDRAPELCALLGELLPDYKVVLIDSQRESGFDAPNVINACGKTHTFMDAAALCQACDLVITPDTGMAHACGALSVPALVLAGSMKPEWRFSTYENFHWIHPADRLDCCPCLDWQRRHEYGLREGMRVSCNSTKENLCMLVITPEEIASKVKEILD